VNWINGVRADTVDARDRGLHYGDGVFTTLRVHAGAPLLLERHLDRLARDCVQLGIAPPDRDVLRGEATRACVGAERAVLKIIVTRGVGGRGYRAPETPAPTRLVQRFPWPDYKEEYWTRGVRLRVCATRLGENEALAGAKHLNRLEQVLARAEWSDPHIAEGVTCNRSGEAIETTAGNLFAVHGSKVSTPSLARCGVRGVMRGVVIDLAQRLGLGVAERTLSVEELLRADEVFITNSVIGIWPVCVLEAASYVANTTARRLQHALAEYEPGYA
jgi:4-amino-4-deoxychorismate lyase